MEQQNTTSQQESDSHITLKSILGGDILAHSFLKRQANLLILIVLLTILYIDNRYSSQQELIEIDRLKKELTDIKYDALTISSELRTKPSVTHRRIYCNRGNSAANSGNTSISD